LGRPGGDGMDRKETRCADIGWIDVARDRIQWRAFVNMVMNLALLERSVIS
jgi:hypothetical protein